MKNYRIRKIITLCTVIILAAATCVGLSGCGRNRNEVRVFCYGDYMDPEVVEMFEEETGIKVVLDTFDTNEEMYPVIKNQAGVYDVVCVDAYMVERMSNEGLLQEIDFENVPNYKHIGQRYKDLADGSYDPGNRYSVPYQWGIAGIMYNTKTIPEGELSSWKDLWDPKYKGKIIMMDSLRDTLAVGLKMNGHSLNTLSEDDLDEATQSLIAQKPLVYKYANDSARDFMIGETADLGVVWNGELLYSQELNEDLDYVIPEEGTELFVDSWVIPKNAFHKENAETWIDFMCRPDIALINFDYLTYSMPNDTARDMLDEETKNNENLFPPDDVLAKCETLRDLGPDGDDLYSKYWKKFKSK